MKKLPNTHFPRGCQVYLTVWCEILFHKVHPSHLLTKCTGKPSSRQPHKSLKRFHLSNDHPDVTSSFNRMTTWRHRENLWQHVFSALFGQIRATKQWHQQVEVSQLLKHTQPCQNYEHQRAKVKNQTQSVNLNTRWKQVSVNSAVQYFQWTVYQYLYNDNR